MLKSRRSLRAFAHRVHALGVTCLLALLLPFATNAAAAVIQSTASAFTGDPLLVTVTIDDGADPGNLVITLSVDDDGRIGDLRGFFANVTDESVLSGLSVTGALVTSSQFSADGVINLGGGSNLQGGGSPCPCDLGIEIGSPGLGHGDDYQSVSFTLSHASLDLDVSLFQGQSFGVRATSVGDIDGSREGSSKLIGVVPEPSTALLALLGLSGLASIGRPRRAD
jgi:hypothetical protein